MEAVSRHSFQEGGLVRYLKKKKRLEKEGDALKSDPERRQKLSHSLDIPIASSAKGVCVCVALITKALELILMSMNNNFHSHIYADTCLPGQICEPVRGKALICVLIRKLT